MQPPYTQQWNPANSPQQRPYSPLGQQAYRGPPPPNAVSPLDSLVIILVEPFLVPEKLLKHHAFNIKFVTKSIHNNPNSSILTVTFTFGILRIFVYLCFFVMFLSTTTKKISFGFQLLFFCITSKQYRVSVHLFLIPNHSPLFHAQTKKKHQKKLSPIFIVIFVVIVSNRNLGNMKSLFLTVLLTPSPPPNTPLSSFCNTCVTRTYQFYIHVTEHIILSTSYVILANRQQ